MVIFANTKMTITHFLTTHMSSMIHIVMVEPLLHYNLSFQHLLLWGSQLAQMAVVSQIRALAQGMSIAEARLQRLL